MHCSHWAAMAALIAACGAVQGECGRWKKQQHRSRRSRSVCGRDCIVTSSAATAADVLLLNFFS